VSLVTIQHDNKISQERCVTWSLCDIGTSEQDPLSLQCTLLLRPEIMCKHISAKTLEYDAYKVRCMIAIWAGQFALDRDPQLGQQRLH